MRDTIDMAREALVVPFFLKETNDELLVRLKDFEALVRADEREQGLAAPVQEPVALTDGKKYRLLEHGEKIEKGDTVMGDDTVTWHPLAGWEVGLQWGGHFMMPMRREKASRDITEKGQP
jgi:hypothetical protein